MTIAGYQRKEVETLRLRLSESPRFLQFIAGPRQVGKTTMVRQALLQYSPTQFSFIPVDRPDDASALSMPFSASESVDLSFGPRDARW